MTEQKNIAVALVAAQMEMGKALKQSSNSHFKNSYADLGNVMDACLPALNKNGIAVIQPTVDDDNGRYVETILIHGESGEQLKCRVPLIVQKNDMQGYGSAVTYARRYGLMAMAGIAPEDDDGNAAAKAAPQGGKGKEPPLRDVNHNQRREPQVSPSQRVCDQMIAGIREHGAPAVESDPKFHPALAQLRKDAPELAAHVDTEIETWKNANKPDASSLITEDEIPY